MKFVDMLDTSAIGNAYNEGTRAIFLETMSNPSLEVAPIESISKIARKHGIALIADTTLMPPYMFDARRFGVNIEVISSIKFISGGDTCVGGLILEHESADWHSFPTLKEYCTEAGSFAFLYRARREIFQSFGASLSPHNAFCNHSD